MNERREQAPTEAAPDAPGRDQFQAALQAQRVMREAQVRVEFRFLAVPDEGLEKDSEWLPEELLTWTPDLWREPEEWARLAPGYRAGRIVLTAPVPVEARVVVSYRLPEDGT